MTEFLHAKDYLIELASRKETAGWMHDLIVRLINKDGELTEEDYAAAAQQLKTNDAATMELPTADTTANETEIRLVSLTHHTGVNALAAEQRVDFSSDITLLYGNNGSGKSSYFRILNEMAGGSQPARIYPNIYAKETKPIDVEVEYREIPHLVRNEVMRWDGSERGIAPLNKVCVFDNRYKDMLLEKRSADTALVHPMGLHLFNALTTAMDRIRAMLGDEIDGIYRSLKPIKQDHLQQEVKTVLNTRSYRTLQKETIEERYEMPDAKRLELKNCQEQYKQLSSTNYDDKIRLAQGERGAVEYMRQHIDTAHTQLAEAEKQLMVLNVQLKAAETAAEEARKKIAILGEIGHTNSMEWRAFVVAGDTFSKASGIDQGICPYCRQPLENHAKDILHAYSDFLADRTNKALKDKQAEKARLMQRVQKIVVGIRYIDTTPQIFGEVLMKAALETLKQLDSRKANLLTDKVTAVAAKPKVLDAMAALMEKYDKQLEAYTQQKATQKEQLEQLAQQMLQLQEHKAIAEQKELFEDWFKKMHQAHELERCQKETVTRSISTLAKTAAQHLLTDSLKNKFQEELDALGLAGLKVSLSEMGARSGQSYMQITLTENYRTQDILSEGEQKGIALALFIAERRMLQSKNPIIMDDPVNSLDHVYTARFIGRLVQLGNQVIIFSHNILLRDSLLGLPGVHECSKDQIGSCKSTGKHLYLYKVRSRSRMEKGCICNSKNDTVKNMLEVVQRILRKTDFTDEDSLGCASLMRFAIEKLIDDRVFLNLTPLKYRGGSQQTINWERMKTLHGDTTLIDQLHRCYNRLSGGDLHENTQRRENPMDLEELNEVFNELKSYAN